MNKILVLEQQQSIPHICNYKRIKTYYSEFSSMSMIQSLLSSESSSQSQVQSSKFKGQKVKDLDFPYSIVISPPHHPTVNFSGIFRGPTTKCYTFLETSHDP